MFLFTNESLPGSNDRNIKYKVQTGHAHQFTDMLLSRKILDVQDVGKPPKLATTGIHIYSQVSRESYKISSPKTSQICQENSTPGLRVKL